MHFVKVCIHAQKHVYMYIYIYMCINMHIRAHGYVNVTSKGISLCLCTPVCRQRPLIPEVGSKPRRCSPGALRLQVVEGETVASVAESSNTNRGLSATASGPKGSK